MKAVGKCEFPDYPIRERAYAVGQRQPGMEWAWYTNECIWAVLNPTFEERCWLYMHRRELTPAMLLEHIPRAYRREYSNSRMLPITIIEDDM